MRSASAGKYRCPPRVSEAPIGSICRPISRVKIFMNFLFHQASYGIRPHLMRAAILRAACSTGRVMLFNPAHETYNGRHMGAATAAPDLVGDFFQCLPTCKPSTRQAVEILLSVGAWTEASLVIVERELKGWQLRRLVYDDGEWVCSLSWKPH